MAVNPYEIVSALAPLRWRLLFAPTLDCSFDVKHTQAARSYPYLDVDGHDHTGRRSRPIRAVIRLMNGLDGRLDWYPTYWNAWRAALDDGSPGDLEHPNIGKIRARVEGYSVTSTAQNRSGVEVSIQFIETRENADQPANADAPALDLNLTAQNADAAIAEVVLKYPTGRVKRALDAAAQTVKIKYPNGNSTGKVSDIATVGFTDVDLTSALIPAKIDAAVDVLGQYLKALTLANDPEIWQAVESVQSTIKAVRDLGETLFDSLRPTKFVIVTTDTLLDEFAERVNNSLDDIISLNPSALFSPIVSAGTRLLYYPAA